MEIALSVGKSTATLVKTRALKRLKHLEEIQEGKIHRRVTVKMVK